MIPIPSILNPPPNSFFTFCPAKINLGLKILFKRSDNGYHQIESIFIPIDYGDSLRIELNKESLNSFSLVTDYEMNEEFQSAIESVSERGDYSKNLIYKVWSSLKDSTNLPGMVFHLTKRIPAGGGLGGGSSNAGAILLYAKKMGWIHSELARKIAYNLGADIPFFLEESACWVTGIGEILEPISIAKGWGILYFPGIHLDTQSMYRELKKSLQKPLGSKTWKEQEGIVSFAIESGDWKSLRPILRNDFEEVAFRDHPELRQTCTRFIELGADYSAMSGSGSTLYGLFSSEKSRDKALEIWKRESKTSIFVPFSF